MKKIITAILLFSIILQTVQLPIFAENTGNNFELIQSAELSDFGGIAYYYEHTKTGAKVIYVDNGSETKEFSICFKTPPSDSKGANHVLEHALLCGSEKYPTKNIMHYITAGSYAGSMINAKTLDDYTYYVVKTESETEYYNIMDIYLDAVFHPLFLSDENIFKQQGIRLEYINGKVQYNGVVYNELKLKSLDTLENSLSFLADMLYTKLYGETAPSFSAGGTIREIKNLTYEDLITVYKNYYMPSNSITYLSGKQNIEKTLNVLDNVFNEFDRQNISVNFEDTKILPEKKVYEYNIDEETKTVDIGFMSSGVMMNEPDYIRYARAILFEIIFGKLGETYPNHYTTGGSGGGIDNSAIIVSGVPKEQINDAIKSYNNILADFSKNGIDENLLNNAIESHFEYRFDSYYYPKESYIFDGIVYKDNPFAFAGISDAKAYLENNPQIFKEVLDKYFINNPYSIAVVSGNNRTHEEPLAFTDAEIEKIKIDTESFGKWADEPDLKSVIEKIPLLGIEDVYNAPHYYTPLCENENGIDFYFTEKDSTDSISIALYFPINADSSDLQYIQLMVSYLQETLADKGVIIDLYAGENSNDNY